MTALARLKELLLGEERATLEQHGHDLRRLVAQSEELPGQLPQLIEQAYRHDPARLSRSLAEPVAEALGSAVEQRRQLIVDVLFPVIGPAIRKAIAESMRALVADLNRAVEASVTPRGLRWRIESLRSGVPYAQVVLRHTLRYRIEHLFLIEAGSGLVIHRESAPDLPDLDSDAVSGMLTAIRQFVLDSIGTEDGSGTLDAASVGELLLWVENGPRASLACFLRGVPPANLRVVMRQALELVHARLDDPMQALRAGSADVGEFLRESLAIAQIDSAARADETPAVPHRSSHLPLLVVASLILLALLAWWLRGWLWERRVDALAARFEQWPGLVVQELRSDPYERIELRGLLDPLADPPAQALAAAGLAGVEMNLATHGFISLDDAIVLRRAAAALQPPPGVSLALERGVLRASGRAPTRWIANARAAARHVPGVMAGDFTRVQALDPPVPGPNARELLNQLIATSERRSVAFAAGTEPTAAGSDALGGLVRELGDATAQARALGLRLRARTLGATDESGGDAINAGLRDARGRWLAERLRAALPGLEVEVESGLAADDPRVRLSGRSARVTIDLLEGPAR